MSHKRIELPSGKRILAYEGFVGISDSGRIGTGYDDIVFCSAADECPDEISEITDEDVVALCDMMASRWAALRDKVRARKGF